MANRFFKIIALGMLVTLAAGLPLQALAQSTNKALPAQKTKQPSSVPFQGTIAEVDKTARTITVGKRVFQVTSETKIFKADRTPALFEDAIVKDHITGSYIKADDGKLLAKSLYLGEKPEPATPVPAPQPKGETKK
jgi:hypothetical protein